MAGRSSRSSGATVALRPGRMTTRPSPSRLRSASRTGMKLTSSIVAISRRENSCPGANAPDRIARRSSSVTWATTERDEIGRITAFDDVKSQPSSKRREQRGVQRTIATIYRLVARLYPVNVALFPNNYCSARHLRGRKRVPATLLLLSHIAATLCPTPQWRTDERTAPADWSRHVRQSKVRPRRLPNGSAESDARLVLRLPGRSRRLPGPGLVLHRLRRRAPPGGADDPFG